MQAAVGGVLGRLTRAPAAAAGVAVRYAGGGGRPGGRPTLSWKQKQALRLSQKETTKSFKLRAFGEAGSKDMEELLGKDWMAKSTTVNLSGLSEFKSPEPSPGDVLGKYEGDNNTRKQINVAALFGSSKAFGELEKKENKFRRTFSHKRLREQKEQRLQGKA